jgi:hypothetical protein
MTEPHPSANAPGRFAAWCLKRVLRRTGSLQRQGLLTNGEYAALALDTIQRLRGERLRPAQTVVDSVEVGVATVLLLEKQFEGADDFQRSQAVYGPYNNAVAMLQDALHQHRAREHMFNVEWTIEADQLRRHARRKLNRLGRDRYKFEDWIAEQRTTFPATSRWAERLIIGAVSFGVGWLLGLLTKRPG